MLTEYVLVKGVEELVAQFDESNSAAGYLSIVIALCYWFTVYGLELMGGTIYFKPQVRKVLSDFAYPVRCVAMSCAGRD